MVPNIDTFIDVLNQNIPEYLDEFLVPGVGIAVIRNGEVVTSTYGYANVEKQLLVTPQTGFNIASISKTVAAWGVMKLVEQGKIDLDAPVEQYLTRWHLPESEFDASGVTVRRLLSHTAGLSLHGYPGWGPDDELPTIEESLSGKTNGSGDVRLMIEPGTEWDYSGGGYTILQLLIEEVSGRSFADYMLDEILKPLGMVRSSYALTPEIIAGSSVAYDEFGKPTPNPRFTAEAAAGLHTTIEDLGTFAVAILEDQRKNKPGRGVLKPETIAQMLQPAPASDGGYGLGYSVNTHGDDMVIVGHSGSNRGWQALMQIVPATGDGFVVVTNGSNGWAVLQQANADWLGWLTGTRPTPKRSIGIALLGKLMTDGAREAVVHYKFLKLHHPDMYRFHPAELNQLGYGLLNSKRVEDAITIFALNIEEYPDDANAYDSLGEAYMIDGQKDLAIANYKKSLEMNPKNTNAVEKLKVLEEE